MPEIETTFCKGSGFSPTYAVPTKRRSFTKDKYVDSGLESRHRRRRKDPQDSEQIKKDDNDDDDDYDSEQPPLKRHIPNSFYGSQSARFGIIPAATLAALRSLVQFWAKSVDVGAKVFKAQYAVCRGVPRYVRDVHRAGVARSVFESIAMPDGTPDIETWLRIIGSQGQQMHVKNKGDENDSGDCGGEATSPRPDGSTSGSEGFDSALRPDSDARPIYRPSSRPVHSSILHQSLIPARLPPEMRHGSRNSAFRTRSTHATTAKTGLQTSPIGQEETQEQEKTRKHIWQPCEQAAGSKNASEKVCGTLFTPFSSAELAKLGFQHSKADVASGISSESQTEPVVSRKQNTLNGKDSTPLTRRTRTKAGPKDDLRSHVLRKAAASQPDQHHPQHQRAQTRASTEPVSESISCPLCQFDNPSTSTFCSACYTPHPPGPAPQSRAQGIAKHDLSPDTYPEYQHWGKTTMVTVGSYHEDFLCTGAAGPPGTINEDGSHISIPTSELQRLNKAKEDAAMEDSMREVRDQERRTIAWENGVDVQVHSEPYYSDLKEEMSAKRLTTRQALSLERSVEVERVWLRRLAGWREEAAGVESRPFPMNIPDYENLQNWELDRLEEDIMLLDGISASLAHTAGAARATSSGENSNRKLSEDSERLAARNEQLKAVQQRQAEQQYLALVAEAQRQARAEGAQFPEGLQGWDQVEPEEQELIRWAVYTNQVNDVSEQARETPTGKPAAPASAPQDSVANPHGASATSDVLNGDHRRPFPETNSRRPPVTEPQSVDRVKEQQAREGHYAHLKQKFEDPKRAEMVHDVEVTRYSILHTGRRWPDDVANWGAIAPAAKASVLEVTEYLKLKEEFEKAGAGSE